jgi:hypothetical protein
MSHPIARPLAAALLLATPFARAADQLPYAVVDTGQDRCFDARQEIAFPAAGARLAGQDAQYRGVVPAYTNHGDGTVTDLRTGLMWQRDPGVKLTYPEATAGAAKFRLAGHADWRLPTIKELYSLMDFRGTDPRVMSGDTTGLRPFIDTNVFVFTYGREADGERIIDAQFATCSLYGGTTMGGQRTMFGVNFADGRIKGYPADATRGGGLKKYYVLHVRGNPAYGKNDFVEHRDGTITDRATGLTWQQADSGRGMNWPDALAYAEQLELGGHNDWRLPNAKELQSLVDYARSPDQTQSAAIDPMFKTTAIKNERGETDYPCFWSSTTHVSSDRRGATACYVAFGRALGFMRGEWMDVHGAGCQRSDPKEGDPAQFPQGRGPQGDAVRILNYVRCVRGGAAVPVKDGPAVQAPTGPERPAPPPAGPGGTQPARGGGRGGFVQHLDRDGDGKVSREPSSTDRPTTSPRWIATATDSSPTTEAPPPRRL